MLAACVAAGLAGCKTTGTINPAVMLERAPQQYRTCAKQHLDVPNRELPYREAQLAYAAAVKYGRRQNNCLTGVIAWSDAQVSAYRNAR
ncbi:hypothetical protein AUC70_11805 [Methyloceanibacter stevinii]|uniref:Uncharacterized protein n=2 Tax=Methyloceanibacter stevinii TaxID=1774970 RepID=A0A1E3VJT4_9HYPH|nr:hypothetical protein AUC70_11805 [Methyloceanibacter stevinii]